MTRFTKDFFAGNRAALRQVYDGKGPIVVTANGLIQRNGDMPFRFRQDASFWYLTGIDEPDVILVMEAKHEYLILPGRDVVREAFDGAVTPELLTEVSGVATVLSEDEGWRQLGKKLATVATPAALPGYIERAGFYSNPARARLMKRLQTAIPDVELVDIRETLMRLRAIKQPLELEAIQQAIDVTVGGLKYVTRPTRLEKYSYEYELEADLTREFRRHGCLHAFDPIVASGQNACQLHYERNNSPIPRGKFIVLDVGADANMYAADISRTYIVGKPSKRQRQVFEAVLAVQDYALSLLKPGTIIIEYEKQVEDYMGEKLRELGLIKSIDKEAVRRYYPHSTGHFLGIDPHDVGDYRAPLEPDMVLTCEPGIYIPDEGIGVRIEDDILITADGCKNLSAAIPRNLL